MGNNESAASSSGQDDCVAYLGPEPILNIDSCDVDSGAAYYIPGLCLEADPGSLLVDSITSGAYEKYKDVVGRLGNVDGEWNVAPGGVSNLLGSYTFSGGPRRFPCSSDTCNKYRIHEFGDGLFSNCCGGASIIDSCSENIEGWGCSTAGIIAPAIRGSPLGNPLLCCFNDLDGTGVRSACYVSEAGNRNSCNKCQRDITSNNNQSVLITDYDNSGRVRSVDSIPCTSIDKNSYRGNSGCQDIAFSYCLGEDLPPNDTSWIYRWMNQDGRGKSYELNNPSCHYALLRNIGVPSTQIQDQLNAPTSSGCYPQGILNSSPEDLRWAQRLMNSAIAKYRRQGYTLPSPVNSPGYSLFQEYLKRDVCCKYPIVCQQGLELSCSRLNIDEVSRDAELSDWCGCYMKPEEYSEYVNNFGINETCTPPCNRSSSIKKVNFDNTYLPCTQGVCIIDDITINIANSSGGDINFDQFCTGCNGGNCSCIISDSTIEVANSQFGEIEIENKCGKVECTDDYGNIHPCGEDTSYIIWRNIIYIAIAVIILVLFIVLCIYLITLDSGKYKK
jgi:hypothetical protein